MQVELTFDWSKIPFERMGSIDPQSFHEACFAFSSVYLDPGNPAHLCLFLQGARDLADLREETDLEQEIEVWAGVEKESIVAAYRESTEVMGLLFSRMLTYVDALPHHAGEQAQNGEEFDFLLEVPILSDAHWINLQEVVIDSRDAFLCSLRGSDLEGELKRQREVFNTIGGPTQLSQFLVFCQLQGAFRLFEETTAICKDLAAGMCTGLFRRMINDVDSILPHRPFEAAVPISYLTGGDRYLIVD